MEGSYNLAFDVKRLAGFYHLGKWKGAITPINLLPEMPAFYHLGKWKGAITST